MISRRDFLQLAAQAGAATVVMPACGPRTLRSADADGISVNDVHSHLNPSRVHAILRPQTTDAVQAAVRTAMTDGRALSVAGGRHAMGGHQFGEGTTLIDMSGLARVVEFDRTNGEIEVEAGIQWPELYKYLVDSQQGAKERWAFVQKQTGADRLSIGGALAANVHGRGLKLAPFVGDVAAFTIVAPDGVARRCSRTENAELFRAAIGGYGLFGVIVTVRLRLTRRHLVQRIVEVIDIDDLPALFERRIADGFEYGDFQFATELSADALLRKGVFSCYRPVDESTPMPTNRASLKPENWHELIYLAHVDRARAFQAYSSYYLTTSGQYYWSDEHQMSTYLPDYHESLADRLGAHARGSEMITEIYVPRDSLVRFMADVRSDFLRHRSDLIYGTIRLIERDTETMLAWAKQPYACIIFNLHVMPDAAGIMRAMQDFRRLIDRGLSYGGSYYLTYHRWAERHQVTAAYPQFAEFLRLKRRLDPAEVFQSEWYRHYRRMFADQI
ncbi:MAG: FAD-binding oxidoreductase [Gemmatimonadota bacterium]|nr:FAD-binding oxidoreductase [Gemmatimonadota bacterium]